MFKLLRLVFFILISYLGASANAFADWQKEEFSTMGTNIVVEVFHHDPQMREQAILRVKAEMERINQSMSTYIASSELSQLNQRAFDEEVRVSSELFELLELCHQMSALTHGAFDITYASVGYLYDFPEKLAPNNQQIQQKLGAINYQLVELNPENNTVRFLHKDVRINLGGVAKGHAVDASIEILVELGIKHALVTAGGDTRLLGDRLGKPWIVGIRDPRDKDKQAVVLPLSDSALSTSGDYERYFEKDGLRYHHIISPLTGKSSYGVQSVSIIGERSVYTDALSTAIFVLGLNKGLGLINSLDNFEAIVMDDKRRLHFSKGLQQD